MSISTYAKSTYTCFFSLSNSIKIFIVVLMQLNLDVPYLDLK
jgi:hypothetical protein